MMATTRPTELTAFQQFHLVNQTSEVTGALWYNTSNNALYIYDGSGWEQVTAPYWFLALNLFLPNPTTPRSAAVAALCPDASAVTTQEGYNKFIFAALAALEGAVEGVNEAQPLAMGPDNPTTATDGDQFYNTISETLLVYSGGQWYSSGGPAPDISNYPVISALQQANADAGIARQNLQNAISTLEAQPRRTYNLTSSGSDIVLTDSLNNEDRIEFEGANGISVSKVGDKFTIDAAALNTAVTAIQSDYLDSSDLSSLTTTDSTQQSAIDALEAATWSQHC